MNEQSRSLGNAIEKHLKTIEELQQEWQQRRQEREKADQEWNFHRKKTQIALQIQLAMMRCGMLGDSKQQHTTTDTMPMPEREQSDVSCQPTTLLPPPNLPETPPAFKMPDLPDPVLSQPQEKDLFTEEEDQPRVTLYSSEHDTRYTQEDILALIAGGIEYHRQCTDTIADHIEMHPLLLLSSALPEYIIEEKHIAFVANSNLSIDKIKCITIPQKPL